MQIHFFLSLNGYEKEFPVSLGVPYVCIRQIAREISTFKSIENLVRTFSSSVSYGKSAELHNQQYPDIDVYVLLNRIFAILCRLSSVGKGTILLLSREQLCCCQGDNFTAVKGTTLLLSRGQLYCCQGGVNQDRQMMVRMHGCHYFLLDNDIGSP